MADEQQAPSAADELEKYQRYLQANPDPVDQKYYQDRIYSLMQQVTGGLVERQQAGAPIEQGYREQQGVPTGPVLPSPPPPARPQESYRAEAVAPPPRATPPPVGGPAPPPGWVPPPAAAAPPSRWESAVRGFGQGATLYGGDELYGTVASPDDLKALRERNALAQKTNPWTYGGSAAVGSILPTMAISRVPGAPYLLGMRGAPIPRAIGGVTGGIALGGAEGALAGEGWTDRTKQAIEQAQFGGAAGLIGGIVSRNILEPLGSAALAKFAPKSYEARELRRSLEQSGMSAAEVDAKMQAAAAHGQQDYSIVDALGEGGRSVLNAITRRPGKAGTEVKDFLAARQEAQGRRVEDMLREGLDAKKTGTALHRDLETIKNSEAKANYDPLRADPANAAIWSQELEGLMERPSFQAGIKDLANVAKERGQAPPRNPFVYDDKTKQWSLPAGDAPDFHFLENLKVAMDKSNRDASGRAIDRHVNDTVKALTAAIEDKVPDYKQARVAYRQASEAQEAIQQGLEAGKSGLSQDVLDSVAQLPQHKQQGFRAGYADGLAERTQKLGEGADKARFLRADKYKVELPAVAGDPVAADTLMQKLGREAEMTTTKNRVTGGSQTAENILDLGASLTGAAGGGLLDYLGGTGSNIGMSAGMLLGGARRGLRALANAPVSPEISERIAKTLTGRDTAPLAAAAQNATGRPGNYSVPLLQALGLEGGRELTSAGAMDWLKDQVEKQKRR